jgi:GNAT superfamily N-acetyltransferase
LSGGSARLPTGPVLRRLVDLVADGFDPAPLRAGIDRIFRATAVRWPADAQAAAAFHDLWLGQYLRHEPELVVLALATASPATEADVLGYIVGCRIDPAISPRFAALDYFRAFAPQTAAFPAHLHINLEAAARGRGIGGALVEALCTRLAAEGVPGIHVVTGRDQRNVRFYTRLGFVERARAPRGATEVLLLARRIRARGTDAPAVTNSP